MKGVRPFRWLLGLVPIVVVAIVLVGMAAQDHRGPAQQAQSGELHQSANAAAFEESLDGLTTTSKERERSPGEADPAAQSQALARAQGKEDLPTVRPYTWWVSRKGNRIKLKGHVPTKADQQTILGIVKATMPELEIDDRTKLATGAPPKQQWLGAVSFALNQLGQMSEGSARLTDLQLVLVGEAVDENKYKAVRNALASELPSGLQVTQHDVVPPSVDQYAWDVTYSDGKVTLSGYVPSDEVRRRILDAIGSNLRVSAVEDGMKLASGAPERWGDVTLLAITQLFRLEAGTVSIRGVEFSIDGVALDDATAKDVAHKVRNSLPASFKSVEKVSVRKGAAPANRTRAAPEGKPDKTLARPPFGGADGLQQAARQPVRSAS